jgi:hypothetical protein
MKKTTSQLTKKPWVALLVGLVVGVLGTVAVIRTQAAGSCPSGSTFKGGHGGGVCLDVETGAIVKSIRN